MSEILDIHDINKAFRAMTDIVDAEIEKQRIAEVRDAWQVRPLPLPEGLIVVGLSPGHSAFMGDFSAEN